MFFFVYPSSMTFYTKGTLHYLSVPFTISIPPVQGNILFVLFHYSLDQRLSVLFFCQCSIYLELDTTLYIVPYQGRLLSEGSQNLPFWLTFFFSVSFNFLYVVVCMFVVIYVASHVCCLYFREAPLYRQSLLVQTSLQDKLDNK